MSPVWLHVWSLSFGFRRFYICTPLFFIGVSLGDRGQFGVSFSPVYGVQVAFWPRFHATEGCMWHRWYWSWNRVPDERRR